jgi:Ca2+-binding RTX toxin-like protein
MVDYTLTQSDDYFVTPFGTSSVSALAGNDTILFGANVSDITITGDDGNDYISGATATHIGTFRLEGGNGNDFIKGGRYQGFPSSAPFNDIHGGLGNDTLLGGGAADSVYGGDGEDWIVATELGLSNGPGIALGGAGKDTIGARGFISARGDSGDDFLYGLASFDGGTELPSITGNQTLSGDSGLDLLTGNDGDDWLYTGLDGGTAYGDAGNDVLVGDVDADTLAGGAGNDAFYGYAGRDWLSGEAGDDTLQAGDGDDVLFSGVGANWLDGGAGDDVMFTEGASDQVFGGAGHNYVYRNATSGGVIVTGGAGIDEFVGGNGASNDTVTGLGGNDYLFGGAGNDLLQGGADNDVIIGQVGNDTLEGGSGVNLLWANDAGNDQILVNAGVGGTQVVEFFEAGGTNDVVRILGSTLTNFADYQNLVNNISTLQNGNFLTNAGSGAQLILGLGTATQTAIWFQGVSAYSLTAGDFLFG